MCSIVPVLDVASGRGDGGVTVSTKYEENDVPQESRQSPPTGTIELRPVVESDLLLFYEHQLDPEASHMAAFKPRDHDAFMVHWRKIMGDDACIVRTILVEGEVAGNVVSWEDAGVREVGYWIDKPFWGKGIATRALALYLELVPLRPLHAHVAAHNVGSIRVLEKCGFEISDRHTNDAEGVDLTLD